jgi:hypothetical protein
MMLALGYQCGNDTTRNQKQMMDVVVKYLKENPAERSGQAAVLSFIALTGAFKCTAPSSFPGSK